MNTGDSLEPQVVDVEVATTAVIREVVPVAGLSEFYDRAFHRIVSVIATQGVEIVGPAFGLYHGPPEDTADVEAGFMTDRAVQTSEDVTAGSLPAGRVARLVHHGGYDELGASWERLHAWISGRDLSHESVLWEVYVTEPSPDMDPADLRTELNWLLED